MAGRAKLQQKRWHLDGGIEATAGQGGEESSSRPSTFLGNYNGDNAQSLALVAYTGNYYDLINYPDTTHYVVDGNYVHTDNNFTHEDKAKLAASYNYVLPVATEKKLGGIKVGDHLEMRQAVDKRGEPYGDFDRLSVIESHFIYVQNATASDISGVPRNSAGALTLNPVYSPTGEKVSGNYIRYNDMAFFSQDPLVESRTVNGKTIKIEQEYMERGGLWWTTRNAGGWIRIQDQFNIISFNDRVGKVYPVGMDDWLVDCEDYDANMVGAMARSGHGGSWTVIKNDRGRVISQFFNGCAIDSLKTGDSGWALMGALRWDAEKKVFNPDPVNSPTGGIISGTFWKLDGLPTLPTYTPGPDPPYMPDTYRGNGKGSFFFMPDGQDRIWVKRKDGDWEKNDWFYLEQLPIATRTRLGGIMVGAGLDITESGVLSIVGSVTSWTGKQGNRRVNEVVAMNGDYDATMITFGQSWSNQNNVDYELKRLARELNTKAPINSPVFTGDPQAPTAGPNDSDYSIANTYWVNRFVETRLAAVTSYTLPPATTTTLGGIIVGTGLRVDENGRLHVNTQGSGSGGGDPIPVVIDTELDATSTNPVENKAIYAEFADVWLKFNDYVEEKNGEASGLTLSDSSIRGTTYITLPDGTKDDRLATTKFVDNAIKAYIQTLDPGGDPSIIVNPYTLPIASASTLGGVRVTGNDGINITNNGTISVDKTYVKDYLEGDSGLKYIRAQEDITSGRLSDIPPNSSGVTKISALYSPAARDMEGHYLKYNAGDDPDTYILWFCDFETNDSYYYINRSDGTHGWAKTLSVEGLANFEDFDLSKYAKIDSPILTGAPEIHSPTADYLYLPDENSPRIATTGFVQTAINYNLTNLKKASTNEYGIVKIKQNGGIAVTNGEISMDGVVSFKGRKGAVEPRDNDYDASMIKYSGTLTGPSVQTALDSVDTRYAKLISPNFTGTPTIYNLPIATQNYVRDWKPIAKTDTLGMIRVGDGLTIDPNTGILSTAGAVTGWTGNQGFRQSGEVIARAGDYNSNMIYYDPQDDSKTVRSELDLKAYKHEAWMRKDIAQLEYPMSNPVTASDMPKLPSLYTGGKYGTKGGHLMLPIGTTNNAYGHPHCGAIILKNDSPSYDDNVNPTPNLYITTTYHYRRNTDPRSYVRWGNEIRLLTTRDLASPSFTGTPTINGSPIAVSRVAGSALGLVKNGGNVVVDATGNMDYTLPIATDAVLGGVKIGDGIQKAADGTISVSGAVTSFNGRTGDVSPTRGDYESSQITYDNNNTVKDKIDGLLDGSALPVASSSQIGAVKIGSGINVGSDGTISMSGVTSFNGRTGSVSPRGSEEDYDANMVGAIARKRNLVVSSLDDVPVNSAGYLTYNASSNSMAGNMVGAYMCLEQPTEAFEGVASNLCKAIIVFKTYQSDPTYGTSLGFPGGIYYTSNYGEPFREGQDRWKPWEKIDGTGSFIKPLSYVDSGRLNSFYYVAYNTTPSRKREAYCFYNRSGVIQTFVRPDSGGEEIVDTAERLVATYINISGEMRRDPISTGAAYIEDSISIAVFRHDNLYTSTPGNNYGENIQGLFYASSGYPYTFDTNGSAKWIKLIDSENITDYIQDVSSLYNTENYTPDEISSEITATLAELNA